MNKKNLNDFVRRCVFSCNEIKQISLKLSLRLNRKLKINNIIKLEQIDKKSLLPRIKNRCIITGRSKSIYKRFHISRIKLREMFFSGLLVGLKKY
jgi:small subunit ribosomal protein S14